MPTKETRYDCKAKLSFTIEKDGKPFHDSKLELDYPNMDYVQCVATQQAAVSFLQVLSNLGWGESLDAGFPPDIVEGARQIAKGKDPFKAG